MSFKTIRDTLTTVWPQVRESLDRVRESRDAVRANPGAASASAQTRARRSWNKVVAEETIWAIAKADLLTTPQERRVLAQAVEWYKSWGVEGPEITFFEDATQDDLDLHLAVKEMLEESA